MIIKSYQNYLFDLDGTLLDTAELVFQTFLHICKKYGDITVDRTRVIGDMGQPLARQIQLYLGPIKTERLSTILSDFTQYQLSIYSEYLALFPDVTETLLELRQAGKMLAIVTSRKMLTTEMYLRQFELFDLFNAIITPEGTQAHKPDPEPALKALEILDGTPAATLFVGDAHFDIQCGNQAGTDTALVAWSPNDPASIQPEPTYILNRLPDLLSKPTSTAEKAMGAAG